MRILVCEKYDIKIKKSGGVDIQVLGIGHNVHIGFNEPTINFERGTHLVNLKESTIEANARFFEKVEEVPKKAIYKTVYGKIIPEVPASILQFNDDIVLI